MCISPDRMTENELKQEIEWLRNTTNDPHYKFYLDYYTNRAIAMEVVLQERFPQPQPVEGLDIGEEKRYIEVIPIQEPSGEPVREPVEPVREDDPDRELVPA